MILYIVDDNTAIHVTANMGIPDWVGNIWHVGFHWDGDHLVYVVKRGGPVVRSVNKLIPRQLKLEYYWHLFHQPDKDWHTDPITGDRIEYRYVHPVEYVFGV